MTGGKTVTDRAIQQGYLAPRTDSLRTPVAGDSNPAEMWSSQGPRKAGPLASSALIADHAPGGHAE
jgi:hypothetical protein